MPWANCAAFDHDELISDGSSDNESNLLAWRINSCNTISAHKCIIRLQFLHVFEHDASRCDIDRRSCSREKRKCTRADASVNVARKSRGREGNILAEYEEQWSLARKLTFLYVERLCAMCSRFAWRLIVLQRRTTQRSRSNLGPVIIC